MENSQSPGLLRRPPGIVERENRKSARKCCGVDVFRSYRTCVQNAESRTAINASLRAFHRIKCGVCVCKRCASRDSQTSCSINELGVSAPRCKSYVMHPSSRRVGPTSARSSASSSGSCPSRDFSNTTIVTASFGSFPSFDFREALFRRLAGRFRRRPPEDLRARFAIGPGLYSNRHKTPAAGSADTLPAVFEATRAATSARLSALCVSVLSFPSRRTATATSPPPSGPRSSCPSSRSCSTPANTSPASRPDKPD